MYTPETMTTVCVCVSINTSVDCLKRDLPFQIQPQSVPRDQYGHDWHSNHLPRVFAVTLVGDVIKCVVQEWTRVSSQGNVAVLLPGILLLLAGQHLQVSDDPLASGRRLDDVIHET